VTELSHESGILVGGELSRDGLIFFFAPPENAPVQV
jgi:hypothetical protein